MTTKRCSLMKPKNRHGGARPGSGRPASDRNIPLMVRVSPEAVQVLDGVKNKSEYVDNLIRAQKEHQNEK